MNEEKFGLQTVKMILTMAFQAITWGRYVAKLTIGHSLGVLGDRAACFGIAVHPLARVVPHVIAVLVSVLVMFLGFYIRTEYFMFFADSTFAPLIVCFGIGVLFSLLSAGIFVIPISIFLLNQISLPGLVLLNLGAWVGSEIYWIVGARNSGIWKDIVVKSSSTWITVILFFGLGGIIRQFLGSTMNQVEKLEQLVALIFLFGTIDLVLGLILLHFWFHFSKAERKKGWWPGYLLGSRLFVRDVQNLRGIAEDKKNRMIAQQNAFTDEERRKVPLFVLKSHQDEIERITQFLRVCDWLQTKVLYRNPFVFRAGK